MEEGRVRVNEEREKEEGEKEEKEKKEEGRGGKRRGNLFFSSFHVTMGPPG